MKAVDTILHGRWVLPVNDTDELLHDHSVVIDDGRISAILPTSEARQSFSCSIEKTYTQHLLMPGLINAHTHSSMNLFRGMSDDLSLDDWLNHHIWPTEAKWVGEQFVHDGSQLAMAEMLRAGTTCFNDMYFFPDVTAEAAVSAGMRSVIGMPVIGFPTPWAETEDEYFRRGLEVHRRFADEPMVSMSFVPHAPYSVGDEAFRRIARLAEELDIAVHLHLLEAPGEIESSRKEHGLVPLDRLETLGLLGPRLLAVHMTQITETDIPRP